MALVCLQSLKSKGYVSEQFAWRHYYWYLKNEGIQYLRDYLNLPAEVIGINIFFSKINTLSALLTAEIDTIILFHRLFQPPYIDKLGPKQLVPDLLDLVLNPKQLRIVLLTDVTEIRKLKSDLVEVLLNL